MCPMPLPPLPPLPFFLHFHPLSPSRLPPPSLYPSFTIIQQLQVVKFQAGKKRDSKVPCLTLEWPGPTIKQVKCFFVRMVYVRAQ